MMDLKNKGLLMLRLLQIPLTAIKKYKYDNAVMVSNEDGTISDVTLEEEKMLNQFHQKYQDLFVYHIIKTITESNVEYYLLIVTTDNACIIKAKHYLIENKVLVYSLANDKLEYIEFGNSENGIVKLKQQESIKMSVDDYIKLFDNSFGTNIYNEIQTKKFPMLNWCFEYMGEDLYIPSPKYKEIESKSSIISNKILETYSYEQEQLFSDYWELDNKIDEDINRQMLVFGYCLALQQLKEMGAIKYGI